MRPELWLIDSSRFLNTRPEWEEIKTLLFITNHIQYKMYNLHKVWDEVPFVGKVVAAFFVAVQLGAFAVWLLLVRRESVNQAKEKED